MDEIIRDNWNAIENGELDCKWEECRTEGPDDRADPDPHGRFCADNFVGTSGLPLCT